MDRGEGAHLRFHKGTLPGFTPARASHLPELVIEFLVRFLSVLLYVILILVVLATLGVDVSSVVLGLSAVIGSSSASASRTPSPTSPPGSGWRLSVPSIRASSSRSTASPGRSRLSASWRPSS
ncbi:protein of unknown function [Methanoculleus bourgensis]|uniref:Uncharacterized protein n=1 Tax=Methanoculleus bourgensis TaxID=83986 RepID=A0A0X8XZ63_9EURY|nr:protein of unknown function [Methanoculleus bourgensis]